MEFKVGDRVKIISWDCTGEITIAPKEGYYKGSYKVLPDGNYDFDYTYHDEIDLELIPEKSK